MLNLSFLCWSISLGNHGIKSFISSVLNDLYTTIEWNPNSNSTPHLYRNPAKQKILKGNFSFFILTGHFYCRSTGSAEHDELAPGRHPEVPGQLPGNQATDLSAVLLHIKRRPAGDPRPVQEPDGNTSSPQEVLWQYQEPGHGQGKSWMHVPCT